MLIPPQFQRLDPRQNDLAPTDRHGNFSTSLNTTDSSGDGSEHENNGSGHKSNSVYIVAIVVAVFAVALLVILYFVLRALRRLNYQPKYLPGKFLKDKWWRWNVGTPYGQVPGGSSSNQNRDRQTAGSQSAAGGSQMNTNTNTTASLRRDTSIRSIITLPAYSLTPKPTEQVIAREGEREGMDVVVEFPETAEEEEARREELMESLYQIRQQRRQEHAEREARRQERREARERGDFIRLEELRAQSRARTREPSVALAEAHSRGRDRRISSVSYAELGYVRHDGSRVRASSRDSDSRPLLTNSASMGSEGPDRSSGSGFISVHSRDESYSSTVSLVAGGSDGDSLTPVQTHVTGTHSIGPEVEEVDVGTRTIPPPEYEHLDWGEAPPYEAGAESNNDNPPRLRELIPLPTIQIDVASPVSNTPTTPTNPQREDQPAETSPASDINNQTPTPTDSQREEPQTESSSSASVDHSESSTPSDSRRDEHQGRQFD